MELIIDGLHIIPQCGETLLEIIQRAGMYREGFAEKPIAAKIAGEIFNLNYIPVRREENGYDRASIRRAMAASNGVVIPKAVISEASEKYSPIIPAVVVIATVEEPCELFNIAAITNGKKRPILDNEEAFSLIYPTKPASTII